MRGASGRGVTLVETLVATVLAGVVVAGLYGVLLRSQRFHRGQPQILDVQRNVRAAAQLLAAELRSLDAGSGDIVAMSDTAVTIKAARALGFLCDPPDVFGGRVSVRDASLSSFRAIDPARDSLLIYRDGDTLAPSDDRWLRARVSAVGAGVCADGAAATRLTVWPPAGAEDLSGVTAGAPVKAFELVRYRLYEDGSRTWWLGVQSFGTSWSATSPVAGPLRPRDGLRFEYLDVAGAPASLSTAVRQVLVTVRGRSARAIDVEGRHEGPYVDSVTSRVLLRNDARP